MCVGEVLPKQWEQGNTGFGNSRKRPLEIGVFFYGNNCKVDKFTLIKTKFYGIRFLCREQYLKILEIEESFERNFF